MIAGCRVSEVCVWSERRVRWGGRVKSGGKGRGELKKGRRIKDKGR